MASKCRIHIEDGLRVAVFPTPEGKSIPVAPERLKDDLEQELSRLIDPDEDVPLTFL
jgi:hypothetical protein